MKPFEYVHAKTAQEASSLLRQFGDRAALKAGGTDLLGILKDRILPRFPEVLVNLSGIAGLDRIRKDAGGLRIGALARLSDLARSPLLRGEMPALAEAAQSVATPQLRNMGTLGGNLCQDVRCWYYRYPKHVGGPIDCLRKGHGPCLAVKGDNRFHSIFGAKKCFAACASDTAVALAALDAELSVVGKEGQRTVPVKDLYTPLGTVLSADEVVTEVFVPAAPAGSRQAFLKYTVREPVDFAVASVAVVVKVSRGKCREARIALGGVAPGPWRATAAEQSLVGKPVDETSAAAAAEAALAGAKPLSKNGYKVEIAKTLVKRALLAAA